MIVGHGIDLVSLPRFQKILERKGDRFKARLFTEKEITYCEARQKPVYHFASRFAAKEAILKALGTGLSQGIEAKDLEITVDELGAPVVQLSGRAQEIFRGKSGTKIHLSLSHDGEYALASVILSS